MTSTRLVQSHELNSSYEKVIQRNDPKIFLAKFNYLYGWIHICQGHFALGLFETTHLNGWILSSWPQESPDNKMTLTNVDSPIKIIKFLPWIFWGHGSFLWMTLRFHIKGSLYEKSLFVALFSSLNSFVETDKGSFRAIVRNFKVQMDKEIYGE